jgi:hypothetical protein
MLFHDKVINLQVFLKYQREELLLRMLDFDLRRIITAQSIVRRWICCRHRRNLMLLNKQATRIQAGELNS